MRYYRWRYEVSNAQPRYDGHRYGVAMSYQPDVWVPRSYSPIEALLQPRFQAGRQLQVFLILPIHAMPRVVYDQKLIRAIVLFDEGAQVVIYLMLWLARYVEFNGLRYEAESVLEDSL
jgi:hypothetical protein